MCALSGRNTRIEWVVFFDKRKMRRYFVRLGRRLQSQPLGTLSGYSEMYASSTVAWVGFLASTQVLLRRFCRARCRRINVTNQFSIWTFWIPARMTASLRCRSSLSGLWMLALSGLPKKQRALRLRQMYLLPVLAEGNGQDRLKPTTLSAPIILITWAVRSMQVCRTSLPSGRCACART